MWGAVEMGAADLISVKLLGAWRPRGYGVLRLSVYLVVITSYTLYIYFHKLQ